MDKGSGSESDIFPDPDPGDPKRPDPTGSATLNYTVDCMIKDQTEDSARSSFFICIQVGS